MADRPQFIELAHNHQEALPLPKTYALNAVSSTGRRWQIVSALFFLWSFVTFCSMLIQWRFTLLILPLSLLNLSAFAFSFWLAFSYRRLHLVFSQEGITYYGVGYTLYTPWDNIDGLAGINYRVTPEILRSRFYSTPSPSPLSLKLARPAVKMSIADGIQKRQPAIARQKCVPPMQDEYATTRIPIPTDIAQTDWQHGEFGAYLRTYATQLHLPS